MDRKFNCPTERASDEVSETVKNLMEEMLERHRKSREKLFPDEFKQLSQRQQQLIEALIKSKTGEAICKRSQIVVDEMKEGRISFAHQRLKEFPYSIVVFLRHDITHLDLTENRIENFEFLRAFKNLKSLILDQSTDLNFITLPPMEKLELFYANKTYIEEPCALIIHLSTICPSLKYLAFMYNPMYRGYWPEEMYQGHDHRVRMFAIFMNPNLIHLNDCEITRNDRDHARTFHMRCRPIDCAPSKYETVAEIDDIRMTFPLLKEESEEYCAMLMQDEENCLDEALSSISFSHLYCLPLTGYEASIQSDKALK